MKDDKLKEIVTEDLKESKGIPYTYNRDISKMELAIHYLADWHILSNNGYEDDFNIEIRSHTNNILLSSIEHLLCNDGRIRNRT